MIIRKFYIYCSNKNHELTSKTRGDMAKQKLDMYLPKATFFCQSSELHNLYFSRHKKAWNLMNCALLQTCYFLPVYSSRRSVKKYNFFKFQFPPTQFFLYSIYLHLFLGLIWNVKGNGFVIEGSETSFI